MVWQYYLLIYDLHVLVVTCYQNDKIPQIPQIFYQNQEAKVSHDIGSSFNS